MVSPELLRRYPFFAGLSAAQLSEIAMLAEECTIHSEVSIFEEDKPADSLYLLSEGRVDLFFSPGPVSYVRPNREYLVGEINAGEPFGIASLVEPYTFTLTARSASVCKLIKIDAAALRLLCEQDELLGNRLFLQTARIFSERLYYTRVQLAAASD